MTGTLRHRTDQVRLAIMLLTRLPVGRLRDPVPTLAQAGWAFPLVGLVVGAILWAVLHSAMAAGLAALPSALIALTATALVTGGLHHDGLADFADGIGGGKDRDDRLRIMRDSRIGSYGALALIFAVFAGASALAETAGELRLAAAVLVAVWSRQVMLAVLVMLPPARPDGLGRGAAGRPGAFQPALAVGPVLSVILAIMLGWQGLCVLIACACVGFGIAALARRRLGGQTGDVLGAVQLATEVTGWLVLSAG